MTLIERHEDLTYYTVNLAEIGWCLAGRTEGRKLRNELLALETTWEVVFDFAGIIAVCHSFVDEAIVLLVAVRGFAWGRDLLTCYNTTEAVRRQIEEAFAVRDMSSVLSEDHFT